MNPSLLTAYHTLQRRGVHEDDLHDAIVELLPRQQFIRDPLAYLMRVAFRRRSRRMRRTPARMSDHKGSDRHSDSPFARLRQDEVREFVSSKVRNLPPRERRVVQMHFLDGLSCAQMAHRLACSLATVRNLIFRAQKRLACSLGSWNDD